MTATVSEAQADVLILGGAPLAGVADKLRERIPVPLVDPVQAATKQAEALVALDEALHDLEELDPRLGQVVQFRFFGGLTEEETGEVLGVTARTVRRDWLKAKGWLYHRLTA